ncbi:MAG: hypothetical protein AAFU41_10985 [Pseudomonadota bacterium]
MTDASTTQGHLGETLAQTSHYTVEDVYWGYMIRPNRGPKFSVALGQAVSFFFGVCFMTACLGILVLPTLFFDGELGSMRVGSATLFGAAAIYLLWFASRGTLPEVHIDTNLGEVREVICNRAGRPTTVGAYSFDAIGSVLMEENPDTSRAKLILQYRDTQKGVIVAEAPTAQLIALRNRLAHDLLQQPRLQSVAA